MDLNQILRMLLVFAALGAFIFYGSRIAGRISAKV